MTVLSGHVSGVVATPVGVHFSSHEVGRQPLVAVLLRLLAFLCWSSTTLEWIVWIIQRNCCIVLALFRMVMVEGHMVYVVKWDIHDS